MGTNLDQSDQKECKVKGGASFSARKQILGDESPRWLGTCGSAGDTQGQATKQSNKSQESRRLQVAPHRWPHSLKLFLSPFQVLGWFSWCCGLPF